MMALLFRCPGPNGSGCPAHAMTAFAIGTRPRDGLSFNRLDATMKRDGWVLTAGRLPQPDGTTVAFVEPICGRCGKAVMEGIVAEADGRIDPSARGGVMKIIAGGEEH